MDPLSDVLSLLKLRNYWCGGFEAAGDWSMAFPQDGGIRFYAAIAGKCWLSVEGVPDPVRIRSGDCLLLPRGRAFQVATDLAIPPFDALAVLPTLSSNGVARLNGGGEFSSVGGHFTLGGHHGAALIEMLPPIVQLERESDKAILRWCAQRMREELREEQPGGFLIVQQLATMLLVQTIRLYLIEHVKGSVGWLFALADKRMATALKAMHQNPAHRWSLQGLAAEAGMSRTSFTLQFKASVGVSPMDYLTRWRMMVAADRLQHTTESIAQIAATLGYESESSFSTAFRRTMGDSPRRYCNH